MCIFTHGKSYAHSRAIDENGRIINENDIPPRPSYIPYRRVHSLPTVNSDSVGRSPYPETARQSIYNPATYQPASTLQPDFSNIDRRELGNTLTHNSRNSLSEPSLPCIPYTAPFGLSHSEVPGTAAYRPYIPASQSTRPSSLTAQRNPDTYSPYTHPNTHNRRVSTANDWPLRNDTELHLPSVNETRHGQHMIVNGTSIDSYDSEYDLRMNGHDFDHDAMYVSRNGRESRRSRGTGGWD